MHVTKPTILLLAFLTCADLACVSQEMAIIDLTKIKARIELQKPPATSQERARGGIEQTNLCFNRHDSPGTLRTTLLGLDREHYRLGEKPTFEVKIENTGSKPLHIPVSPHLADLQPANRAETFDYWQLVITFWVGGTNWDANTGGAASLYGAESSPETMLTLAPGQWVRVIANGELELPTTDDEVSMAIKSGDSINHVNAKASLHSMKVLLTSLAGATINRELCLTYTHGDSVPIKLRD